MKKAFIAVFFLLSLNSFAGNYCVFPFENRGTNSLNYMKYGFEIYIDSLFKEDMCNRINAIEEMDIPSDSTLTLATKIVVAKKMNARYMITGFFEGDSDNLKLTVKVFEVDGKMGEYIFEGSLENILNNSLKSFFEKFDGFNWPFGAKLDLKTFEKFAKALTVLCIQKDVTLVHSYLDFFKDNDFYLRTLFYHLYSIGEYALAEGYFSFIKTKNSRDYLLIGLIKAHNREFEEAIDFFKSGNRLKPDDVFLNNIAGCYLLRGNLQIAKDIFPFENRGCVFLLNGSIVFAANKDFRDSKSLLKSFCGKYGVSDKAGQVLSFLLKEKGISVSMFKERVDLKDLIENFEFLDSEDCDLKSVEEIVFDYKTKAERLFSSGKLETAEEYYRKIFLINPFEKRVLTVLCKDYNDSDSCKLLKFLEDE